MPYKTIAELPDNVKNSLPRHAREIYLAAFNNAWDEYRDADDRRDDSSREETAHKVTNGGRKTPSDGSRQRRRRVAFFKFNVRILLPDNLLDLTHVFPGNFDDDQ